MITRKQVLEIIQAFIFHFFGDEGFVFGVYEALLLATWPVGLWVYYTKIPIYPIFYLLKGDYRALEGVVGALWVFPCLRRSR